MSDKLKQKRARLLAERKTLRAKSEDLLTREDYDDETAKENGEVLDKIDEINRQLGAIARQLRDEDENADEGEGEEKENEDNPADDEDNGGEDEKDRSVRNKIGVPAYVRSRGRRSSNENIHEHAKREHYSIARAITSFAERGRLTGLEAEVDQELARFGTRSGQFKMPTGSFDKLNRRDLTLSTGAGAVPQYWDAAEFIDYLYPQMVGPQLGFKYTEGLAGVTKFPRQTTVPTVQAVAEQGSATGSEPDLDNITLTPHTMTANVTISRKFAMQSVVSADRYVMEAGSRQLGVQLDQWALTGSGSGNNVTGLLNNSAVTNTQVATTNAVAYSDTIAMEKLVANANAYSGNLGWVTSPAGYAKLQTTAKLGSTFPVFIVDDEGKINGINAVRSTQVPTSLSYTGTNNLTALIFGAWQWLYVATFGNGMDVIVDPFTGSKAGDLTITFLLDADTNVAHGGAFAVCPNILP